MLALGAQDLNNPSDAAPPGELSRDTGAARNKASPIVWDLSGTASSEAPESPFRKNAIENRPELFRRRALVW